MKAMLMNKSKYQRQKNLNLYYVFRILQINKLLTIQQQYKMIPKQQNLNEYGFKYSYTHRYITSPSKYPNITTTNIQHSNQSNNHYSNSHTSPPITQKTLQNQQNKVLGFRRKSHNIIQTNTINSKNYLKQYNIKDKETNKFQNSHPSTTESLRSDHQIFGEHPKLMVKQSKITRKLHLQTKKSNFFNKKAQIEVFNDFLYKFTGILSCHVRVLQRSALFRLIHYGKSVKKATDFSLIIQSLIINRLKNGIIRLKEYSIYNKNNAIQQNSRTNLLEKLNPLDQSIDQNFQMQESAVVKGLKYLQDRSNLRKNIQQYIIEKKSMEGPFKRIVSSKRIELTRKISTQEEKQIDSHRHDEMYREKQVYDGKKILQNKRIEQNYFTSGNNLLQNQNEQYKKVKSLPNEQTKKLPNISINPNHNQKSINRKEQLRQNANLQRQSIINRKASWVILEIQQQPFNLQNRKQLFQRVQVSQRKYYLNPNAFNLAQPDTNDNNILLSSHSSIDDMEIYDYELENQQRQLQNNEQQYTLPMFQYVNNDNNDNNDNVIQSWQVGNQIGQKTRNQVKKNGVAYKNGENEFENLPSFNQKNKNILIQNKNNQNATENSNGRIIENEKKQKKGYIIDKEKQKKKTAQQIKNQIKSSKQSSFKISDEDYSIEEKLQQHTSKYTTQKIHQIQEYFTDTNIFHHKNIKNKLNQKNVRSSYDFPQQNRFHDHKNINIAPNIFPQRAKSITYSFSTNSLNQQYIKNQQMVLPPKNNPMIKSQTFMPRININYQSPRNLVLDSNQNKLHTTNLMYPNYQNISIQSQYQHPLKIQSQQSQFQSQQNRVTYLHNFENQTVIQQNLQTGDRKISNLLYYAQPKSLQKGYQTKNFQFITTKPFQKNICSIQRPNTIPSYISNRQDQQIRPGQHKSDYVRAYYGLNSPHNSKQGGYCFHQTGIKIGPSQKISPQMRQSQSPGQQTQPNKIYLNINQSPIKKGIDLTRNCVGNTISYQKALKNSKSDKRIHNLRGGKGELAGSNNKKLKITTVEYY